MPLGHALAINLHREYVEYKKSVPMLIPVGRSKEAVKAEVHNVR
jgi:hypothetical protein